MPSTHRYLRWALAAIWLVNGLFCKVLGLVPRHAFIVSEILGSGFANSLTVAIGVAEIVMAAWVLSGWHYRICAVVQITVILVMNAIECVVAPDLLLWGRFNALFAIMLSVVIYYTAFGRRSGTDQGKWA